MIFDNRINNTFLHEISYYYALQITLTKAFMLKISCNKIISWTLSLSFNLFCLRAVIYQSKIFSWALEIHLLKISHCTTTYICLSMNSLNDNQQQFSHQRVYGISSVNATHLLIWSIFSCQCNSFPSFLAWIFMTSSSLKCFNIGLEIRYPSKYESMTLIGPSKSCDWWVAHSGHVIRDRIRI